MVKMFDEISLNLRIRSGAERGRLPEVLFMGFLLDSKGAEGAEVCKSCRSRQELSNEYLHAKIGFNTAENEPLKICQALARR